jgi:hypothetical protein
VNDPMSRRNAVIRLLSLPLATAGVAATAAGAAAAPAVDPSVVGYVATSTVSGKACSNCMRFVAPNACKVVKGTISPAGYCRIYTPAHS